MKNTINDLLNLLYPNLCLICGENLLKNEQHICLNCLHNLPKTNYHLLADNPIEKRFWGKVPIYRGTAFFTFQKGSPFQTLLHSLKYKGNKEVGRTLGKYAAADLLTSPDYETIDILIPVPLHPKKLALRGYNQSEWICNGLSEVLNRPIDTESLIRIRENTTQTKKSVYERYTNTEGVFGTGTHEALVGKHILLVDDVLTTGSTLEACISTLTKIPNVKISVFTLAVA